MKQKVLFSWSGGKDSAMALYELRKNENVEIVGLLTTVTKDYDRISMHGVRVALLEKQAESIGLPLEKVFISAGSSNDEYENAMREMLERHKAAGVTAVAFGDLFLEDLKKYREDKLALVGMKGEFPIWKRNTTELSRAFIKMGFKSIVTCADSQAVSGEFAGREYDETLLADLPPSTDPCFENGECHSFVYAGPIFQKTIAFTKGEVVLRDERFFYCDLIPQNG